MRRERQLLVNHADTRLPGIARTARGVGSAVQRHRSRIGADCSGEYGHQRAFAGTVLPYERAYFAATHREADTVERDSGSKRLAHVAHLELCGYGFNHRDRSGCSSSFTAGSAILSRVMSCAPVSIRFSTAWPRRCSTNVLTPRYPMFTGSCTTSASM